MLYGIPFLFSLALLIFALFDIIVTDRSRCRNLTKELWVLLIIFLPPVGALAWLLLGRPEKTRQRPSGSTRLRGTSQPSRPLGPDDDPRFCGPSSSPKRPSAGPAARSQSPETDSEDAMALEEELRRKRDEGPEAGEQV